MNSLTVNLAFSTLIFWIVAKVYVFPALAQRGAKAVLVPILLLHSTRHLGLMFLATGATYSGMPAQFAYPAAFGDLAAALLALAALAALMKGSRATRALLWVFNIGGAADLLMAIALATAFGAPHYMGAAYWIPALWVPALLVSHYIVFVILLERKAEWSR